MVSNRFSSWICHNICCITTGSIAAIKTKGRHLRNTLYGNRQKLYTEQSWTTFTDISGKNKHFHWILSNSLLPSSTDLGQELTPPLSIHSLNHHFTLIKQQFSKQTVSYYYDKNLQGSTSCDSWIKILQDIMRIYSRFYKYCSGHCNHLELKIKQMKQPTHQKKEK